jgi:hypothetical protein
MKGYKMDLTTKLQVLSEKYQSQKEQEKRDRLQKKEFEKEYRKLIKYLPLVAEEGIHSVSLPISFATDEVLERLRGEGLNLEEFEMPYYGKRTKRWRIVW